MKNIFKKTIITALVQHGFEQSSKVKVNLNELLYKKKPKPPKKEYRTWRVNLDMKNVDFFQLHVKERLDCSRKWTNKYGCYTPEDIKAFHLKIFKNFKKPKDDFIKSRNKLLLFINFLHTKGNLSQLTYLWPCGLSALKIYIIDVIAAILFTYHDVSDIIFVPNHEIQHLMSDILLIANKDINQAVFHLDNTHKLCLGQKDKDKRSWKFHWKAAWSHLFVMDRIFGIVVACNIGNPARKHDLTILKESNFGINFKDLMGDLKYCLADSAYLYFNEKQFAPLPKRSTITYKLLDKDFRKQHKLCRVKIENFFALFFINQNIRLTEWPFIRETSVELLNCVMICAIILWNQVKLFNIKVK